MKQTKALPVGALVQPDGVLFRLWAPKAKDIGLVLDRNTHELPMAAVGQGYFERLLPDLKAGALYRYRIDGGEPLPDPASRYQPQGVHSWSQVIDPSRYQWHDEDWLGVAQKDLVFFELHVGTFTAEGTFHGVQQRLPYLKELGITAVQLMPVADFPGRWNWGYDQAALYAPSRAYGTPDDLRALVDAAHQIGLAVFLDVIYNHFGPDGAYAAAFAPVYTDKHETPWGQAINLDDEYSEGVRDFFVNNALHWLREYHVDGLRLDATHALQDDSEKHFLAELAGAVAALEGRKRYLVAEDERKLPTLMLPTTQGGYGLDGVWADEFHHQMRNMTAGDTQGYYAPFDGTTAVDLAKTLRQGWFKINPSGLALERFVICIQNHDQIGNRPTGERLHHQIPLSAYRAASALLLFAPELPLLFMGQEWAATAPFQFFTDHHKELGALVSAGRKQEFQDFEGFQSSVPDPQDPATFRRSKLNWDEREKSEHAPMLLLYQDLLKLRRELSGELEINVHGDRALTICRGRHVLLAALADDQRLPVPKGAELILHTEQTKYAEEGRSPRIQWDQAHFPVAGAMVFVR